jgi:spore coat polysaccharide biosynthesis protein SpsF
MTKLEEFFRGDRGNQYNKRNDNEKSLKSYLHLFSTALARVGKVDSVIDYGSNVGYGLRALKMLLPDASMSGVEINADACRILKERMEDVTVYNESVIGFSNNINADLVTITGVLVCIDETCLENVYKTLFKTSNRYIFIAEYHNPTPTQIEWRDAVLNKRDFAGEMLDMFPALHLLDYGFLYSRDIKYSNFPLEDTTWFLLEKKD